MTKTCKNCGDQFELRPGKPGFANVCEDCSGLRPNTPLPKPVAPKSTPSLDSAALELLRAVEALEGKPDPQLRSLIQPLLKFNRRAQ